MTPETMSPDAMTVLSGLLRARPANRDELARAATLPHDRFVVAVDELVDLGLAAYVGPAGFEVADVEQPLTDLIVRSLDEQADSARLLAALVTGLPGAVRAERVDRDPDRHPTERVHGTRNQWDLWMRLMGETPPRAPIATFPDFLGLATVVLENRAMLREARLSLGFSLRTIVPAEVLATPQALPELAEFAELGIELRTLATLPGWFYVDREVLAALPLAWGEAVPASIALVREPALLQGLHDYAQRLWSRASPLPSNTAGWDAVLDLLAQGLSDSAVARALGMSVRTVRRRVADAADFHGASTRFALAVAWSRARGAGGADTAAGSTGSPG